MIKTIQQLRAEAEQLPADYFGTANGRPAFHGDELLKFAPVLILALKLARIFCGARARLRIDAIIFWLSFIKLDNEKNPVF